jgi:thioredoxin-related protein
MKITMIIAALSLFCLQGMAQENGTHELPWMHNFEEAKSKAEAENKVILMSFSGSDWCANCIRLDRDLFQHESFQSFAEENLVLLQLDFPSRKKNQLPAAQKEHNEKLAEKYNKTGTFPKVILLDSSGKSLGQMSHPLASADAYIQSVREIIN